MQAPRKLWKTVESDRSAAEQLAVALSVPLPVATVLTGRGIDTAVAAEAFLTPLLSRLADPFLLPDMDKAVERIRQALDDGSRIAVFGDFDADGVTATVLLVSVLRGLGGRVTAFVPSRFDDSYGLTPGALARCIEEQHPDLVVTVDCGMGSGEAIELAARSGVDVVVTDHHEPSAAGTPAFAVVNPKLGDLGGDGCSAALAGVGVAFKLCHALVKRGLERQEPATARMDLREMLDLVAIGTVADIVPLLGENRTLVHHGLALLSRAGQGAANGRIGLDALRRVARCPQAVDSYHIAFVLAPRLNASGRLGSADSAIELLLTTDGARAEELAAELDAANSRRKEIEKGITAEAVGDIDRRFDPTSDFGLVTARDGWHVGTIGIVASRLCSRYYRPVVVVGLDADGLGRGSCRSIEAVDIVAVLKECSDLLDSFGGHKMAAGLTVERGNLEEFRARFNERCAAAVAGLDLRPVQRVDGWLDSLAGIDRELFDAVDGLRPFGMGHPRPTWGIRNVQVVGQPRKVGKDHLKMTLASGGTQLEGIAFGMAGREVPPGDIDVAFRIQQNTYGGRQSLELNIQDFRCSGEEDT